MTAVRVKGGDRLRSTLRRFPDALTKELKGVIAAGAELVRDEARDRVPVDTGELKAALLAKPSKDGLSAKDGYSPKRSGFKRAWKQAGWRFHFIEFGTKKTPARPFLRPAFRTHRNSIVKNIERAVMKTLQAATTWKG